MPSKPTLSSFPRQTALITGASSGIGYDLAHVLAEHGHDLILVARSAIALEQLSRELSDKYAISAIALPADLRDPSAPTMLRDVLTHRGITIDILINNAGFGIAGTFDQTDLATELDIIAVNIAALTALTKQFLPAMLTRGSGRIMNVASTAAFQPGPRMAVYYASKAYVLHFTEAVAEELRHSGVTLTALCPGPTHTGFAGTAQVTNSRLFHSPLIMRSPDVARYGYSAMMRGTRVAIPGVFNRLVAFSNRLAPRRVSVAMARMAQENR